MDLVITLCISAIYGLLQGVLIARFIIWYSEINNKNE